MNLILVAVTAIVSFVIGIVFMNRIYNRAKKRKKEIFDPYDALFVILRYRKFPDNQVFMDCLRDLFLEKIKSVLGKIKETDGNIEYIKQQMGKNLKTYAEGIVARKTLEINSTRELEHHLVQNGIDADKLRIKCLEEEKEKLYKQIMSLEEDAFEIGIKLNEGESSGLVDNIYPFSQEASI